MKNDKAKFPILERIDFECNKRGWNHSTLAEVSGVNKSIISRWYNDGVEPSVSSIEKLCNAFGITLAQFFLPETDKFTVTGGYHQGSMQRKTAARIINAWSKLTTKQRESFLVLMESIDNK